MAIAFPNISPVAIQLGPIKVHWYGISYVASIILAWQWGKHLLNRFTFNISAKLFEDFLPFSVMGIIIGGRLGHVLFYDPLYYLNHLTEIIMVWKGGMSFHGGILGVGITTLWYSRRNQIPFFEMADLLALMAPIGLFFGRITNFINQELCGIPTEKPWGVIFSNQKTARHPTQLYEAILEGIALFTFLNLLYFFSKKLRSSHGVTFCLFLCGYAIFRLMVEPFKVQEVVVHIANFEIGMGIVLCMLMLLIGVLIAIIMQHQVCANTSKIKVLSALKKLSK